MPLKEQDLKDPDAYKKACRADLSKVLAGNAKFWIYKDVELPLASGKKQKYPAFLFLVDDNGIRNFLSGKRLICKGTCGIKEERIAFDSQSGTVPYGVLKTSVPQLLGKAVWIPTGTDDAGDGKVAEAPPSSTVAEPATTGQPVAPTQHEQTNPPAPAADLAAVWNKLAKDVQAFVAAHPERKEALFHEMNAISALLKGNKAAEATQKIHQVRAALDAPAAPPGGPPPSGAPAVTARWNALAKRMQAAAAANPEKKAEIFRAGAEIQEALKAGKVDVAAKLMDAVEASHIESAAPTSGKEGKGKDETAEAAAAEDDDEEKEAAAFRQNLKQQMVSAMSKVKALGPVDPLKPKPLMQFMAYLTNQSSVIVARRVGPATKKLLVEIAGVTGGKFLQGECVFEEGAHTFVVESVPGGLAKKLTAALFGESGQRYRVRARTPDGSVALDSDTDVDPDTAPGDRKAAGVRFAQLRLQWEGRKQSVSAQLESLRMTILEEYDDPQSAAATTKLDKILGGFNAGLGDALDDLYTAVDPESRKQFIDKSLAILGDYLGYVDTDPLIAHVERNPFLEVGIRDSLAGSLEAIQSELQSAA